MAGNLQLYSFLLGTVDGTLLAESQQITITRTTNSQAVSTVAKGYAGESPGAAMCEFDVTSAMPSGGFEFDAGKKMAGLIPTDLFIIGPGGSTLKGKCFIVRDTIRHGVNQEATYEFSARGPLALFE